MQQVQCCRNLNLKMKYIIAAKKTVQVVVEDEHSFSMTTLYDLNLAIVDPIIYEIPLCCLSHVVLIALITIKGMC